MKRFFLTAAAFLPFLALVAQPLDTTFKAYEQTVKGTALQIKMMPVPGGSFRMGSTAADKEAGKDETPSRTVSLSPFWMAAYETTYDEFDAFMQDEGLSQNSKMDAVTRPSQPYIDMTLGMGKTGGFPANSMQQFGALMYCRWLYQKTGIFYRLPTEAEWEYACRAGAQTIYPWGNNSDALPKYAWYAANSNGTYHKTGTLQPNAWGLYDMLGNVEEWTLDQYDAGYFDKLPEGTANPVIKPSSRHPRTVRGGSFRDDAAELRPANRLESDPIWNRRDPQIPKSRWWNADAPFVGFRIVRPVVQPSPEEATAFFKQYLGQ